MARPSQIKRIGTSFPRLRMFVIADGGWGKTVFCGTAPKALFITTDPEGTASAAAMGSDADEWIISMWDEWNEAFIWFRNEGHKEYEFLIIDNITELQRMAMDKSMEISRKQSKTPQLLDEFVPQQMDYQRSQRMLEQAVLAINDLPVHVIYTSHIQGLEDQDGEPFYSAAIHGQKGALRNKIVGYANVIGMGQSITKGDKVVRRLWFSHHEAYRGKDRTNALGRYKDDATIPELLEIIGKKRASKSTTNSTAAARRPVRKTPAVKGRRAPARTAG